jgi:hypothetical protein
MSKLNVFQDILVKTRAVDFKLIGVDPKCCDLRV